MDPSNFDALRVSPVFATFPKETQDVRDSVMSTAKDVDLSLTLIVGDVPKIPRKVAGPVWISSRNP